jgi:hypothetical protein
LENPLSTGVFQEHMLEETNMVAMLLIKAKRLIGAKDESSRVEAAACSLDTVEGPFESAVSEMFKSRSTA